MSLNKREAVPHFVLSLLCCVLGFVGLWLLFSCLSFLYHAEWQRALGSLIGFVIADHLLLKFADSIDLRGEGKSK